jgi:hypothetical protein
MTPASSSEHHRELVLCVGFGRQVRIEHARESLRGFHARASRLEPALAPRLNFAGRDVARHRMAAATDHEQRHGVWVL